MIFDFTKYLTNIIRYQKQYTLNLLVESDDSSTTTDNIMNYLKANTSKSLLLKNSKGKRDIFPGFLHRVADE
ncbi:3677_t:CDS:2 [Scutellospora calospora]|uniref:3677_t:CDS:1 n=1 Tax=Scutellospora calospora TaxID=85575 RepID=A0ACA9JW26_9GLOM|nr:3677_t:CDS:2 [Scutellospora calospora]